MIVVRYHVGPSQIPGAGRGLFLDEPVARGAVLIAPDRIDRMITRQELDRLPKDSIENQSSVRWFEHWHTISADWPDECYVNHSDEPTGLWHLGFIFASRALPAGVELTADYRYLLGDAEPSGFADARSGREIIGLPWAENVRRSTQALLALLA